jgi:hypothetical protein
MDGRIKCFAIIPLVFILASCATAQTPETTRASKKIQADVMEIIRVLETTSAQGCAERTLVNTEIVKRATAEDYSAVERWTLDRCGQPVRYLVTFKPGPSGDVDFNVRMER